MRDYIGESRRRNKVKSFFNVSLVTYSKISRFWQPVLGLLGLLENIVIMCSLGYLVPTWKLPLYIKLTSKVAPKNPIEVTTAS